MARTVLLVAAEAREFAGIPCIRSAMRVPESTLAFARSTDWNGVRLVLAADGPGRRLALRAVTEACRLVSPDVVVSVGLCGALEPELKIGEILSADRIIDEHDGAEYAAESVRCERASRTGSVVTVDAVAVTVSDKSRLRGSGAVAVEMEAAAVARYASDNKLPFFCIKAVSDESSEALPLDFNAVRDLDGRFSRPRIVAAALARPWTRIPALIRLDRNTRTAAGTLGEFLADCRF